MKESEASLERKESILVKARIQAVWNELTRLDDRQRFYFDSVVKGELKPGAPFKYVSPNGKYLFITGETIEVDVMKRWVQNFRFAHLKDRPTRVIWDLKETPNGTQVAVTHTGFEGETETYKMTQKGWPHILGNLKAVMERGKLPVSTRLMYGLMKVFMPFQFKRNEEEQ